MQKIMNRAKEYSSRTPIHSPCDGSVFPISNLNDSVFSSKTLGDGVYIIPSYSQKQEFYSPLESATVSIIAKTKHAVYLADSNCSLLMHIGLETSKLDGSAFDMKIKVNDHVDLNTLICQVDLESLVAKEVNLATVVVIDPASKFVNFQLAENMLSAHDVKRGDLIGYASIGVNQEMTTTPSTVTNSQIEQKRLIVEEDLINYVSPQKRAAQQIFINIGGAANFKSFTHCMTRLRLDINNKTLVKNDALKKIPCVKDIHWNANELQIIIGGDVNKVYDEFRDYVDLQKITTSPRPSSGGVKLGVDKVRWSKRIFSVVSGVIGPILPVLMITAIVKAIYGILSLPQIGVLDNVDGNLQGFNGNIPDFIKHTNWISYIIYVIGDLPILFFGLFFFLSVVKYMKGDILLGTAVSLILCSPIIYSVVSPYSSIFSNFNWEFFSLPGFTVANSLDPNLPINVMQQPVGLVNMSQNIFVMTGAGVFFVYFDRWVKTWMPGSFNLLLSPALVTVATVVAAFTFIGISMTFINYVLMLIAIFLSAVPWGIGAGMYALLWQPLVITGAHVGLAIPLMLPLLQNQPSSILLGAQLAALAQSGAGFAIALKTKNMNIKTMSLNTAPVAILGITEPVMYGVNLPKGRPFLLGCLGSGVAGIITGALGVKVCSLGGGLGMLVLPALVPTEKEAAFHINVSQNVGFGAMGLIIAFAIAFALVYFFYTDFKSIAKKTKSVANLIKRYYKISLAKNPKLNLNGWKNLETELNNINKFVDSEDNKKIFKEREDNLSQATRIDMAIKKIDAREDKVKARFSRLANVYKKSNQEEKLQKVNQEFRNLNFDVKKQPWIKKNNELQPKIKTTSEAMNAIRLKYLNMTQKIVADVATYFGDSQLLSLNANYENAFNTIDIRLRCCWNHSKGICHC